MPSSVAHVPRGAFSRAPKATAITTLTPFECSIKEDNLLLNIKSLT